MNSKIKKWDQFINEDFMEQLARRQAAAEERAKKKKEEENQQKRLAEFAELYNKHLIDHGIKLIYSNIGEIDIVKDDTNIGTIRINIDWNWAIIENIELDKNYIGKGIGFLIYETLYKVAKKYNLKGLASSLYSEEISQRRSELATKVLEKLIHKYGGEKHDVSSWVRKNLKDKDNFDYFIDGRGKDNIEIRKV